MASAVKFNLGVDYLAKGALDLNSDTIKIFLSNTAPTVSHSTYSQESGNEISSGNGYTTGGAAVSGVGASNSSGTESIAGDAVEWTASGGTIGPFRYLIVYDDTASGDPLLWYFDYGSSLTLNSGDSFTATPTGDVLATIA